jgi:hypothetical protein
MKLRTLLALGAASLGLFGYTLCQLRAPSPKRERPAAVAAEPGAARPGAARPRSSADIDADREALAIALRSRLERALEAPEPSPPLPSPESRVEAEVAFEAVMASVEELADKGDRVPKQRRRRLYRAANDAFAALSQHLDPRDPNDAAELEDAYARLKLMLREIDAGPPGS